MADLIFMPCKDYEKLTSCNKEADGRYVMSNSDEHLDRNLFVTIRDKERYAWSLIKRI